jgi:hypothetical protein
MKRKLYPQPIAYMATSVVEAKRELDGPPVEVKVVDWSQRRASVGPKASIELTTVEWISALPVKVRPHELASHYPRIANRICALWDEPIPCTQYLKELMIVRRAKRQGFPGNIAREIGGLAIHYEMLHPVGRAWT